MAMTFRIRRRAAGGAAGAPASLQNAELAFNEVDDTLYFGKGTGGAGGTATTVEPIGGKGAVVMLTGDQTVAGAKTFTGPVLVPTPTADGHAASKKFVEDSISAGGFGNMLRATYDPQNIGADAFDRANHTGTQAIATVTGLQGALDGKLPSSHAGAGGSAHAAATTSAAGFMSAADKTKLDGVAAGANNFVHPTGDGSLHIPATGTTSNGKFLKAGTTAGAVSWETLTKADAGLGNVDNTADTAKPVSTAQQTALNLKANLASPSFTGTPSAPTAAAGTNTTQLANTAFVQAAIAALISAAPGALDTLNELAAAIGDDPNFAATITNSLATKQPLDATLTALAGVTTAADRAIYFTGADVAAVMTVTAAARSLLDDASIPAMRTTLQLDTMALQSAGAVAITGGTIDGIVLDGGTF